jgi:hypothetical protein
LFVSLANEVYAIAILKQYECVFGFPNGNSEHGFKKYLKWEIDVPDTIATIKGKSLKSNPSYVSYLQREGVAEVSCQDEANWRWRLARPAAGYKESPGLVLKTFGDQLDIVYMNADGLSQLDDEVFYNVLIDHTVDLPAVIKSTSYTFGCRWFSGKGNTGSVGAAFKKDLLLSDVF